MLKLVKDIMLKRYDTNRKWFNNLIAKRDGLKCRKCGSTRYVVAYHIVPRNKLPLHGNSVYNGIMLCHECRKTAQEGKNECYTPDVLFALINSSIEKVIEDLTPKKPGKAKSNDK